MAAQKTGPKGLPIDEDRLCEGKNSKGRMCRMAAVVGSHLGSHFCAFHDPRYADRPVRTRWDAVRQWDARLARDAGDLPAD